MAKKWEKERIDKLLALYATGLSQSEIQRQMGVSDRATRKYLMLAGVQIRPKGYYSKGDRNPAWKGGRVYDKDGYVLLYAPDHPFASNNRVREHRLVMEQVLGRYLLPTEVVDHLNGVKDDNRSENLRLFSSNAAHLAVTLEGRCPKWSEDGNHRIDAARRRTCRKGQTKRGVVALRKSRIRRLKDEALAA